MKDFSDLLTDTTEAFRQANIRMHGTTTFDGVETRFEIVDRKRHLINKICYELAEELEEKLKDESQIDYLGFTNVKLEILRNNEDSNDQEFIECDIWEQINKEEFTPLIQAQNTKLRNGQS